MPTIADKLSRDLIVFLLHQAKVECSTVADFIISVVQTSCEQDVNTAFHLWILLTDTKFGQCCYCSCSHNGVLQHNSVVDIPDVLGRLCRFWSFHAQHMQYPYGKLGEFTVLDEFAKVGKCFFLAFRHEFDQIEHAFDHSPLEVIATLLAQNTGKERQHTRLLGWELQAESSDGLYYGDLELVCNLGHESADLGHEAVD